ncbi:MAG: hypothetical protein ACI9Z9_002710, partial [Litorivivens sp.]
MYYEKLLTALLLSATIWVVMVFFTAFYGWWMSPI